jgi:hypothetical protein
VTCPSCTDLSEFCECRNVGADIAAKMLSTIAETGRHAGVFGSKHMENAVQEILALHKRIEGLVKRLAELHPASAHPITVRTRRAK